MSWFTSMSNSILITSMPSYGMTLVIFGHLRSEWPGGCKLNERESASLVMCKYCEVAWHPAASDYSDSLEILENEGLPLSTEAM
jgi:hypothetical protein